MLPPEYTVKQEAEGLELVTDLEDAAGKVYFESGLEGGEVRKLCRGPGHYGVVCSNVQV